MIEDIIAQAHMLVDTLTFDAGNVALSALRTLGESARHGGPFSQLLGIHYDAFGDGRCTALLEVKHHLLNPLGIAHGGVTFALADSACGCAAFSALGEPRMVTQDMQIRYHGPARPGQIMAQAEVVHLGRRTITTQCRITQNDLLIASVTATFAILSDSEVQEIRN
ncbi:MAG: PaaI family thioesterase [Chloroflexi bacterium]|nr:PaaI family thioesterase [Chloroflexota bacterium]MCI0578533.1 PaaI family thioesterase [Chloroflexota bacterium]MCI0649179.1 PaaI family thioesterase [Chloroflexota bacterium]MCI0725330.1 PaaI family thioesterase [Chloroflexota bacterium]